MAQQRPLFTFASSGLDQDTFHVVRFTGTEAMSSLYRFEILLVSSNDAVDFEQMLVNPVSFSIQTDADAEPALYHGVLEQFEQLQKVGDYAFCQAVLVPKLWRLTLTHHSQIFLNKTPQAIIQLCLDDGGLIATDYEGKIKRSEQPWEYVCQYNESHFHFFSHWTERLGYYYYFDQSGPSEKLIFTDTRMSHEPIPACPTLDYTTPSGLDFMERQHVIKDFTLQMNPLPKSLKLKNYHYEKPGLHLQVEETVSETGIGDVYSYGENFLTLEIGKQLAKIRAEELRCRHKLFSATSQIPHITPGYQFTLNGHFRPDFNGSYLITSVSHEGGQEAYLTSGLGLSLSNATERPAYRNRFTCIPADVQFRSSRQTAPPRIQGTLPAWIDAASSGEYAELDEQGRYKVIMPFDLSDRTGGKASAWLRKVEPYAGSDHGIHFPLHKDTEVVLSFFDGDPNRPYILAAAPNPTNPNVVNDQSQTQCRITTGGGNKLHFEDQEGSQGVLLATPSGETSLSLGSLAHKPGVGGVNDKIKKKWEDFLSFNWTDKKTGFKLSTDHGATWSCKWKNLFIADEELKTVGGASQTVMIGSETKVNIGNLNNINLAIQTLFRFGLMLTVSLAPQKNLSWSKFSLTLDSKRATDKDTALTNRLVRIEGTTTELNGQHRRMADLSATLANNVSQLAGEVNSLEENHNAVVSDLNMLAANTSKLAVVTRSVISHTTQTGIGKESNIGMTNEVIGSSTQIISEENKIQGQASIIATDTTTLATLYTIA